MDDFVKRLLKQMLYEFQKGDRSGAYGYTQKNLAYNSNKIEGSKLTEEQTASIFETGTLGSDGTFFRTKDVEEMTGHFTMFNYMLQTYNLPLSHDLIKQYHFKLKAGVFEDIANGYPIGEYKNRINMVMNVTTAPPDEVPDLMTDLINRYEETSEKNLAAICRLHAEFEKIHPFQDGNGRVGRMLIFKECLRNGVCPLIIYDDNRMEYYHALNATHEEHDFTLLEELFVDAQKKYHDAIDPFLVPLSDKSADDYIKEAARREEKIEKQMKDAEGEKLGDSV